MPSLCLLMSDLFYYEFLSVVFHGSVVHSVILAFSLLDPLVRPQYVEMQQGFLHTIQRLQLELIELRDRTGEQEDVSQAAQDGSAESSYVQSKGSNMAANGSALADGNQSTNDSFKVLLILSNFSRVVSVCHQRYKILFNICCVTLL